LEWQRLRAGLLPWPDGERALPGTLDYTLMHGYIEPPELKRLNSFGPPISLEEP
jgi:hypothetical protein